jgi:cyclic pyranopterin monophosphate synthase
MKKSLTHIAKSGQLKMVDISTKKSSWRAASASGTIKLNKKQYAAIRDNKISKGNVVECARLAGILAAKNTSQLIPLAHSILLDSIQLEFSFEKQDCIKVISQVKCKGATGVEMEALSAVSIAVLTIYDMVKALGKHMLISDIQLETKSGGTSGSFSRK